MSRKLLRIPSRPLGRVRLAFLGLGAITVVLGMLALLSVVGAPTPAPPVTGIAWLTILALLWLRLYVTGRAQPWLDPLAALALASYALALPVPEFGLGAFYVHLYISALYGTRWTIAWSIALTLAGYLGAVSWAMGSLAAGLTSPLLVFQVPALALTAGVMRLLYEALMAQESLAKRVEEASRMEAVGRLTGGIAHDFNNMLTAITGSIELALLDLDDRSAVRKDLTLASETAQRAGALTQQLLTFSKRKIMRPTNLRINHTLREVEGMLSRMAGDNVELRLELHEPDSVVLIDPVGFEQVVMNLVVNARDAMGEEGGEVVVRTDRVIESGEKAHEPASSGGDGRGDVGSGAARYALIEVTDTGPGMDDATRSKAFEPFFTTKSEGTGLGLSTVYGVVTGAGGQVTIESSDGEGTTVRVLFPVAVDAAVGDDTEPRDSEEHAKKDFFSGPPAAARILVVEDETGVRSVMRRILKQAGFTVVDVGDAESAFAAWETDPTGFDLVITDLSLPGMSGTALVARLRDVAPELPVLLISGYSEHSGGIALANLPSERFLEKPFGSRDLVEAAGRLIGSGGHPLVR